MTKKIRVAGATLNQTPLDWDGNLSRITALISQAKQAGVQLLTLPELCISGYNCEDRFFSHYTAKQSEQLLTKLLPQCDSLCVVFGMPLWHQDKLFNAAIIVQNQTIIGIHPKKRLPADGVHYEPRWFHAATEGLQDHCQLAGHVVPFGDFSYCFDGFRLAIEICEEAWQSPSSATRHKPYGLDLVVNPSASHFSLGKYTVRENIVRRNSKELQCHYLHTNILGLEAGRMIYDGGVLLGLDGEIIARGQRFGYHDGALTIVDLTYNKHQNNQSPLSQQASCSNVIHGQAFASPPPNNSAPVIASIYHEAHAGQTSLNIHEEIYAAITLGLFDYLRKSHSKGFVVSLSGGSDSAATAVLVAHMIASAVAELGVSGFCERLHLPAHCHTAQTTAELIKALLTTVYQKTQNSSITTETAAQALAEALHTDHHHIAIDAQVQGYRQLGEQILGRSLDWSSDDLALQNIQARCRAPLVWLLANVKNALLLTTSNRSELAVGYATMDGDSAGGLAPLAGIAKSQLQEWLLWCQEECSWGLGPLPTLKLITQQAPTAELRPLSSQQTDEDDLMPYPVLSNLEELFIASKQEGPALLEALQARFPNYSEATLQSWIQKFARLWATSQWKRDRAAPSFFICCPHLDSRDWYRHPIFSGFNSVSITEG